MFLPSASLIFSASLPDDLIVALGCRDHGQVLWRGRGPHRCSGASLAIRHFTRCLLCAAARLPTSTPGLDHGVMPRGLNLAAWQIPV